MLLRRMNRDIDTLREGIGNAGLPRIIQSTASTILCLVLAFLRGELGYMGHGCPELSNLYLASC